MADPVTLGVIITGLVGAYKAYTEYKAAVVKAEAERAAPPAKSDQAAKGEQAAPLVKAAVQQHGDPKAQQTLALFEDEPETYDEALRKVLARLAERSPAFAQQLQTLAQQANIQTGGIKGAVNVSGGKVDQAAGINTGTMTYHARDDDEDARRNRD